MNNSTYLQYQIFHEALFSTTSYQIVNYLIFSLIHVVGPILLAGIVSFEKYGGDPQKRNIINRLLSLALINQIVYITLVGGSKICREIFGLISFENISLETS